MSAVITPFKGTELFNTASFNNRISQINTGFSYVSNPNLLDNWYFGNPVNQRGQTEYAGSVYTIDRWRLGTDKNMALSISDDKLSIVTDTVDSYFNFDQPLEAKVFRVGATYTLSFLVDNYRNINQLYFSASKSFFTFADNLATMSFTVNSPISSNPYIGIQFKTNTTTSILAAKLELGSTQTLAHREGNKWVLNEIPDYGEQLRRCQRYFVYFTKFTGVSGRAVNINSCQFMVPIPVTLRDKPVISDSNVANWRVQDASGKYITITGIHAYPAGVQPSYITIFVDSAAAFTVGAIYTLSRTDASGPVSFSADL